MAFPEPESSLAARIERALDGVPSLLSYLVFTSLERYAPAVGRGVDRLGSRRRRRVWWTTEVPTGDGAFTMSYHGTPDRLSRWLLHGLGGEAVREVSAEPSPGAVPSAVELRLVSETDAPAFVREGWLLLPRYVHHRQLLGSGPGPFERRVEKRLAAEHTTLRMSRDVRDLERFLDELYDPMLKRRHGDRALRTGRALLRWGQLTGGLCVAEIRGRAVAAAVAAPSVPRPGELEIWALGVGEGAPSGSALAPILGWIGWARERGFKVVDHVASLPLYSDGLTRQKLRWGTTLSLPSESRELVAVRVHGASSSLRSWLSRHSFAARSRDGVVRVDVDCPERFPDVARGLSLR